MTLTFACLHFHELAEEWPEKTAGDFFQSLPNEVNNNVFRGHCQYAMSYIRRALRINSRNALIGKSIEIP